MPGVRGIELLRNAFRLFDEQLSGDNQIAPDPLRVGAFRTARYQLHASASKFLAIASIIPTQVDRSSLVSTSFVDEFRHKWIKLTPLVEDPSICGSEVCCLRRHYDTVKSEIDEWLGYELAPQVLD